MLAPTRKPSKLEQQMAANIEDLAKKFEGFQEMMQKTLDKLSGLETWRRSVDESMGGSSHEDGHCLCVATWLEHTTPPPPPPAGHGGPIDVNVSPTRRCAHLH